MNRASRPGTFDDKICSILNDVRVKAKVGKMEILYSEKKKRENIEQNSSSVLEIHTIFCSELLHDYEKLRFT